VKRIVTGAHYGLRDWLAQRVTAVIMTIFVLCLAGTLLVSPLPDYPAWKSLLGNQWMRIAFFLFLIGLFWHAWIGIRNILMDYVHATGIRLALQIGVIVSLLFYTVWSAEILWALGSA
jgi:succinate dehydrogenase / fumarate reductase membrane anchor subunit